MNDKDFRNDDADVNGERVRLLAEIDGIRSRITETIFRTEEVSRQIIPGIKADFWMKIGVWRVRLVKADLAARRAKRRYALARSSVNRGRSIDGQLIEKRLDDELAAWRERVRVESGKLNTWLSWRSSTVTLSASSTKELKRLFRRLARRCHPDLHPGDERRAEYYAMAQHALVSGDLDMMKALDVATADMTDDMGLDRLSAEELRFEIDMLEDRLRSVKHRLEVLTSTEPYTLGDRLSDVEWVTGQVNALRDRIDAHEASRRYYDERYEELMKGVDHD
ncbi:DnaJ-like protein [Bifidobacterium margollesii]|uniref:DnaJ-like protein n=1 Tax=Bifidobacterium margollesii TaxID=2020964 RepID=A0A2N5J9R9_9BIFI|nr:J domain-containing protein [Bifidobacterium margollesii]PLS30911.1 DnaJ-like protein [Bifidobacterium margollesii]